MRQLIVNADDFGLSDGVNRGILYGHQKGIITSTTVMINCPDAPAGLETALKEAPELGIGLHINLTWGRPVSPVDQVRSLVDETGLFYDIKHWSAQLAAFDPEQLAHEIMAQFEQFTHLTGKAPDHLDAHHHVIYLHPAALQTALALAQGDDLPLRSAGLDMPPQAVIQSLQSMMPDLSSDAAQHMIDRLQTAIAAGPAPFWPARLEMGFFGARATLGELLVILTTLPEDSLTEIMCHPGYADEGDHPQEGREIELGHLTHAAALECVRSEGIQLVTFGDTARDPRLLDE